MATSARLDELKKKFDESPRRYFAPLANEYRKLGDLTQAIALCRAHLPNQPGHVSGHIVLAQALYEARELGEARSTFEAALDLDPENLIALRYLGDIAREQGEPQQARSWYERVLDADPRNDEIAGLLVELDAAPVAVEAQPVDEYHPAIDPSSVEMPRPGEEPAADIPTDFTFDAPHALAADDAATPVYASALETFAELPIDAPADASDALDIHAGDEVATAVSDVATPDAETFVIPGDMSFPEPDAIVASHSASDDPFFGDDTHDRDAIDVHQSPLAMGELEAVAEPSVDDWFGAPHAESEAQAIHEHDATATASFDDSFFPDLASATPVTVPVVADAPTFALDLPDVVDVKAPTPPYVRADESRASSIPTPPFLAALDANDALPADEPAAAEPADAAASFSWSSVPTPVETPAVTAWNVEAPVSDDAFDLTDADDATVVDDALAVAAVSDSLATVAESEVERLDELVSNDEPAFPHEVIAEVDVAPVVAAMPDAVADTVSLAAPEAIADEVEAPTLEVDVIEEPVTAEALDALASLGTIDAIETEETFAQYAQEFAGVSAPDDLMVEYGEFVPPADEETPDFIASSISVPLDEPDAYSVGAPELSAHEPFPMEADADRDVPVAAAPVTAWEEPVDDVAPIAGLVTHELPQDAIDAPTVTDEIEDEEAPAAESPAFVTETMAELYLQQGFHDEALSIYRQLLAQQPEDPTLRDRVAALERGASSAVVEGIVPRDLADRAGQSVRSFFAHFARRQPRQRAEQQGGGDDDADASDPHGGEPVGNAPAAREPSFAGVATREEALTVPDAPTAQGSVATLTQLFAAGAVSGADEHAASTLASAFGGSDAPPAGQGGGTHERELSLEHLFRDVPARSSGAVTLDEFYEGSSGGESDPASQHTEDGDERDADIEQFTAWLEGLKKK